MKKKIVSHNPQWERDITQDESRHLKPYKEGWRCAYPGCYVIRKLRIGSQEMLSLAEHPLIEKEISMACRHNWIFSYSRSNLFGERSNLFGEVYDVYVCIKCGDEDERRK